MQRKKVAVLMGGTSNEREVSLESGRNVAEALASLGTWEVLPIDITDDSLRALPADTDVVYVALHGGWGENGGVQSALDALGIPYTGPGVRASRLAMDKIATKRILDAAGIPTARWAVVTPDANVCPLPLPVVVKPPADGSSVGVSKVASPAEWAPALRTAADAIRRSGGSPDALLVESFIPGRETTVGVLDGDTFPAIEIVAPGGWYGYWEKYESTETRYPFLADSDDPRDAALDHRLRAIALDAFRAIGCRGITRVDFRVSPEGECFVLELNTSPGFTAHSLVPKAGMRTGLSFAQVCEKILASAACGG